MKILYYWLLLLCLLFSTSRIDAQNKAKVDSLISIIEYKKTADTTLIKAYNDLSIQYAISDKDRAFYYVNKALEIAKKNQKPRGIAGAMNCKGVIFYYQKEYDSAIACYTKALRINKELNHQWGQASALHQIGAVYNRLNRYKEAIESFKKSGEIFLSLQDSLSYIKTIENIGVSFKHLKYYNKALENFLVASKYYDHSNNGLGSGRINIHISNILIYQEEYHKALQYLTKSLEIAEDDNNKILLSTTFINMGVCFKETGRYREAILYFKKALLNRKTDSNLKTIALAQSSLGDTYFEMQEYKLALSFHKEALNNYSKKGDQQYKSVTHNAIAKTYVKLQYIDSAMFHGKIALQLAKEINDLKEQKEATQTLALIAEQIGDSKIAYQHYKQITFLKDTLLAIQQIEHTRELQYKYESEIKEKYISELSAKNYNAKLNNIYLVIIFLFCVFSLSLGIIIFRKKFKLSCIEKVLLNRELDHKNKELTTNSLQLAKKNEFLESLKEEVKQIHFSEDQNRHYNYQKLLQILNFTKVSDKDWENFKNCFEQLHNDFYIKIKYKYPDVTSNELRLMALLKINLSSKEIASILNITQEGVRKARYRLRKKLNIDTNQELVDEILSF